MPHLDRQTRHSLGILAWVAVGLFLIYLGINLAIWVVVNLLPTLFCLVVVVLVVYAMFVNTFKTTKPAARPLISGAVRRNGSVHEQIHPRKGQDAYQSKNTATPTHRTQVTPARRVPGRPASHGNWRG